MIKRSYFYFILGAGGKSSSGIVEVRSFLPNPVLAFDRTIECISSEFGCSSSEISVQSFNRV